MTDKEKVIKELMHSMTVIFNTIALLKEQEEQSSLLVDTKMIGTKRGDIEVYCCRACRTMLDPAFNFCPNCGKEIKWK